MDLHWFLLSCIGAWDMVLFVLWYHVCLVFWSGAVILLSGAVIPDC